MAKIKINKAEIEKMIRDQLGCDKVVWDKEGNASVELDMEEIKKKEKTVEHHHYPGYYPIYIRTEPVVKPYPYWKIITTTSTGTKGLVTTSGITKAKSSGTTTYSLNYCNK